MEIDKKSYKANKGAIVLVSSISLQPIFRLIRGDEIAMNLARSLLFLVIFLSIYLTFRGKLKSTYKENKWRIISGTLMSFGIWIFIMILAHFELKTLT